MDNDIILTGEKISLKTCTIESWHDFYRNYIIDPMMDDTLYLYDYERVEKNYHLKTTDTTRQYFSIICEEKVIGIIYLKHINKEKMTTEFGITLIDDSVKGKGYGTEAVNLLIDYTFNVLCIKSIIADSVLRNTRSQYVLEKVGFIYTHEDGVFKYYRLEANYT